jgi:hypothetical protein
MHVVVVVVVVGMNLSTRSMLPLRQELALFFHSTRRRRRRRLPNS